MANNHEQFIDFNKSISLHSSKKEELKENRDSLRKKIKKYFDEEKSEETKPRFSAQGSYMMKTVVNPIPVEEEDENGETVKLFPYDLDDGVYFIDDLDNRKSENVYHNWIYNAVKDHTTRGAIKKNTCVRVMYADGHHIDLPIYFKEKGNDTVPQLADKSAKYTDSDPREFYKWFNRNAGDQLKRIVRYLKAWRDKQNKSYSTRMPNGLVLTILATNNYRSNSRDDIAFRDTLKAIQKTINESFVCYRPTTKKDEDLLQKYSESHFKERLSKLVKAADEAIDHDKPKEACKKWQKYLGDRFSCSNVNDNSEGEAKQYQKPAVFSVNAGSAY